MSNVLRLRRKPRPLRKTYSPSVPFTVEREDQDNGTITYEVVDTRPESFHTLCTLNDGCDGEVEDPSLEIGISHARADAEKIARGLNLLVALGKENVP